MTLGTNDSHSTRHAFCAWCGNTLVESARFCPSCGREVAATASVPDAPPAEWVTDETWRTDVDGSHDTLDGAAESDDRADQEETTLLWQSATPSVGGVRAGNDEAPQRNRRSMPSRRWLLTVAAGLALLMVAGVAGMAGYRYMRDQPVRDAFGAAQSAFAPVVRSLSEAKDVEQVSFAGERAAEAVRRLESHRSTAASVNSDLSRYVVKVIEAEVDVAKAGAQLSELSESDVTTWGDAHGALDVSLRRLSAATASLRTEEAAAALKVPDSKALLGNLETVVGAAVADVAESSLASLLGDLESARKTADVRDLAEEAARDGETAKAAMDGVARGSKEADTLDGFVGVYDAIAGLGALDGDALDDWGSMRQPLSTALAAVASDSAVAAAGGNAVEQLNQLVSRARTRLSDWKAAYDAAVEDKTADSAALDDYAKEMKAQMRAYSALREDLSEWIQRVEDPSSYVTYDEAYSELSQAQWDRQGIRDEMNAMSVPTDMESAHAALVGVVDDAISAMQSAYDGATDSDYCMTSCFYNETPGWRRFSSESGRITDAYRAADESWHAALASAEGSVSARKLPRKPEV